MSHFLLSGSLRLAGKDLFILVIYLSEGARRNPVQEVFSFGWLMHFNTFFVSGCVGNVLSVFLKFISTGSCLFTCSLLSAGPSEDRKVSFSQISAEAYLKLKLSAEMGGVCPGCATAAQMHWLVTASGVWRSVRSDPRGTSAVGTQVRALCGPAAGGGLGAQLLPPPSPPSLDWHLCPHCSLGFPVIQVVEGSNPLTWRSELPLQVVTRLSVVKLCYGSICPPFSPHGWADFGSLALVFKRLSCVCGPCKNKSPKETNVMWWKSAKSPLLISS